MLINLGRVLCTIVVQSIVYFQLHSANCVHMRTLHAAAQSFSKVADMIWYHAQFQHAHNVRSMCQSVLWIASAHTICVVLPQLLLRFSTCPSKTSCYGMQVSAGGHTPYMHAAHHLPRVVRLCTITAAASGAAVCTMPRRCAWTHSPPARQ